MHPLQGRLILMTRRCTEVQGSTVRGPRWDRCTGGGTQPLSPHMIPLWLDTLSVYLVRCLVLQWFEILSQRSDDWQRNCREFTQPEELCFMWEDLAGHTVRWRWVGQIWAWLGSGCRVPRPERKAASECVFKCQALYISNELTEPESEPQPHLMSPIKTWIFFISLNSCWEYSKITCSTSHLLTAASKFLLIN